MRPDPHHRASLAALHKECVAEIKRRVAIHDYRNADFVASEVLVSLIRARFGLKTGVLDAAAAQLIQRITVLIHRFIQKNPEWSDVVNASSETVTEAAQSAWVALLKDPAPVSYAEVRFLPWVETRMLDYLREQIALKNQHISSDDIEVLDDDGNAVSIESTLGADALDQPDEVMDRERLEERLTKKWKRMDKSIRNAVYFRLEMDYDWPTVAKFLKCSIPTARKYYRIGLKRLNGEIE